MIRWNIKDLHNGYLNKEISPVEITKQYLKYAEEINPEMNAYITIAAEEALSTAKSLEKLLMSGGKIGSLFGVPVSIKDNIDTHGIRTTAGSKIEQDRIPERDSIAFSRLRKEEVVLIGKNNMHEFAFGVTSENPHYGTVKNPWNKEHVAGGSSGGSAAAVAAGLSVVSVGSDTGGSVRGPSASNGVVGLKPTRNLIPPQGTKHISWTLDHVGPIAANMTDMAIVTGVLSDDKNLSDQLIEDLRGVKVGVPTSFFNEQLDAELYNFYTTAISQFESLGCDIVEVELPDISDFFDLTLAIAISEAGHIFKQVMSNKSQIALLGEDLKVYIEQMGSFPAYQYIGSMFRRDEYLAAFNEMFESIDLLITPTLPKTPQKIGVKEVLIDSKIEDIFHCMNRFTAVFNIVGYPALALPCGITTKNLPASVQLIAAPNQEGMLMKAGYTYEQNFLHEFYKTRDAICLKTGDLSLSLGDISK
ncbi:MULTISPECIES: amidase [Paenibacillus]|uniref:amidase n=1 Tax=Paenibacillus TaxID=44249 RepID=UPI00096DC05F|nr:amidase [Paenibacillus odorifer]OMD17555.1 hypothetical protein BJP50_15645 [Paenibacillus odorifer]